MALLLLISALPMATGVVVVVAMAAVLAVGVDEVFPETATMVQQL